MTVLESLKYKCIYPIADGFIESVCIDRELVSSDEYTKIIGASQSYELAYADLLVYLHDSPNIDEQDLSVSQLQSVKESFLRRANDIYAKYDDAKLNLEKGGYIGEDFNA